jgi:hypothetical protein
VADQPGVWDAPTEPGKWSPAEITTHLILAFEAALLELETGEAMRSRTRWYHRVVIRATFYRRLLAGGPFPRGARAPRETRPPRPSRPSGNALSLVERIRDTAQRFARTVQAERVARPSLRLTHPYFGRITLRDVLYVSARHIDHHRAQLPTAPVPSAQRQP